MRPARIPILLLLSIALAAPAGAAPERTKPAARKPVAKPRETAASTKTRAKAKFAKPAAKPVSPAERAVAVAIREQAAGSVKGFYATRGFWPLWAKDGRIGPEAGDFIAMLASAQLDGLDPVDYRLPQLRDAVMAARGGSPAAVATAELVLSRALAAYVADVRAPVKTGMIYVDAELKPRRLRPADVLAAAARTTDFPAYVSAMGWMSPHYVRLRRLIETARRGDAAQSDLARLRLNLDRARLLPGPWVRHIVVDAATARLFYYQKGKQQGMMRVVAGTAETPTPMMAGLIRYAILNPYWNVPVDLARKRVAPKIVAGASLASLRFEALTDWSPAATRLNQSEIDWPAVAEGRREVRLRQLPGPANSMGRVKFMFPNDLGIYLHDTPDRALLTKPVRHFSNGCVRLEDAPRLGRWLLGKPLTAYPKLPEQDVALAEPVPVYLTYLTATPTAEGLGFVADAYKRDGKAKR